MAYMGGMQANFGYADNPFNPGQWNWNSFNTYFSIASSAMMGANMVGANIPGLSSLVGKAFGHELGSVGKELARAGAHGLVQGGLNTLLGGNFWEGFAAGAASSLAGSGLQTLGMGDGGLPFAMGGVGALTAWAVTGDPRSMMGGFMTGLDIGLNNHTAGEPEGKGPGESADNPRRLPAVTVTVRRTQTIIGKYNNSVKGVNDPISFGLDLYLNLGSQARAGLKWAGKATTAVGWATTIADGALLGNALRNGDPWREHAYNFALGTVGSMGPVGAATALTIDSHVEAAKTFGKAVHQGNNLMEQWMKNVVGAWY